QVFQSERCSSQPQVVPRQQRPTTSTKVLLCRRIIFLPASRTFQLNDIQGFGHHRESLAHAFFVYRQYGPVKLIGRMRRMRSTTATIGVSGKIFVCELRYMMEHNLPHTISILARTPAALNALLRDLAETWTCRNEGEDTWSAFDVAGDLSHCERRDRMQRATN